ncbi:MAG: pyruvate kinase [Desulfurococcales archaeon]|nr:pyruvate kinase [Desulfurococcales archaeon]
MAYPDWTPVKIIATLGPSSRDPETVREMIRAGAWGFRINTSHGDPRLWEELLEAVLDAEERLGVKTALIIDLEGPRVRIAHDASPVAVAEGDRVVLCSGGRDCIPVTDPAVFKVLEAGDVVILGDGVLWFTVEEARDERAILLAGASGVVKPGMGVAVRGKDLPLPPVTGHDEEAIRFMSDKPFSHVMMSYVRSGSNIRVLRSKLREHGVDDVQVIAKIESPGGVRNAEEITGAADGIVIARGDLGMHYPLEEMPIVQGDLALTGVAMKKPVIVATELLTSMVERPTPTRSEITDIFQAVKEGADALLLTSETAIGKHPVEAVEWARKASQRAYENTQPPRPASTSKPEALALGLVELAESINAPLLVYSMGGRLPNRLASFKPKTPIYVGVPGEKLERRLRIRWGLAPLQIPAETYADGMEKLYSELSSTLSGRTCILAAWSRERDVFDIRIKNLSY